MERLERYILVRISLIERYSLIQIISLIERYSLIQIFWHGNECYFGKEYIFRIYLNDGNNSYLWPINREVMGSRKTSHSFLAFLPISLFFYLLLSSTSWGVWRLRIPRWTSFGGLLLWRFIILLSCSLLRDGNDHPCPDYLYPGYIGMHAGTLFSSAAYVKVFYIWVFL